MDRNTRRAVRIASAKRNPRYQITCAGKRRWLVIDRAECLTISQQATASTAQAVADDLNARHIATLEAGR